MAYLAGAIAASVLYVVWVPIFILPHAPGESFWFELALVGYLYLFEGFWASLAVMILPWSLLVTWSRLSGISHWMCFGFAGAALTLLVACAASSLSPKPLFVEHQIFLEGVAVAAERQGVCFVLAGLLFGVTYLAISVRRS